MTLKLSTLAVALGLGVALPHFYGLAKPAEWSNALRRFPRSLVWGYVLMLLGTGWFLYYLSLESIADFASYKNVLYMLFAAVGIGTCIFVQDFLAVIDDYAAQRDRPDLPHTSRLSPHLHFGEISPRQIVHAVQVHLARDASAGGIKGDILCSR